MIREARRRIGRVNSGATMIELVVALVMLAIGLLPLLLAMNKIFMGTLASGTRSEALLLAAERVDQIKAEGFVGLELSYLAGNESTIINDGALSTRPYSRQVQLVYQHMATSTSFVDATPAQIPTDFIKVTATVNWSIEGRSATRSVTTLLAREGGFE